jgi:uncharacterized lipoprotein YmbA
MSGGVMYLATIGAVLPMASCSKRNPNFSSYTLARVALVASSRSQSFRLNGPNAFFRVL